MLKRLNKPLIMQPLAFVLMRRKLEPKVSKVAMQPVSLVLKLTSLIRLEEVLAGLLFLILICISELLGV